MAYDNDNFGSSLILIIVATIASKYEKLKSAQRDANTARQKFSPRRRTPSRGRRTAKI